MSDQAQSMAGQNKVQAFQNVRRHVRYVTRVRCKLEVFKGVRPQPLIPGVIRNISQGGTLIEAASPLKVGDHLYLIAGKRALKISAGVVSWTPSGYHLKFLKDLDPKVAEEIAHDR